jgi:D-sedoheptulose 7-phosphate isomerase
MEPLEENVRQLIGTSLEIHTMLAESHACNIATAARSLVDCLLQDHKMLIGGEEGLGANVLHFTQAMLNPSGTERPPLPIIALSTDLALANLGYENHTDVLFERQIQALGQQGDQLILLTTSGNAHSILHAIDAAHAREMKVIVLSGHDGGQLETRLRPEDKEIRVPSDNPAFIREMHLLILHCFCDAINRSLFGTGITT